MVDGTENIKTQLSRIRLAMCIHLRASANETCKSTKKTPQQEVNLRASILGLNGNICVTSGLGSFDNCVLTSVSGKLLAVSALVDS